jgi:hypothetical protein
MKNKKIITLCASVSFYKKVLEVKDELAKLGFRVRLPSTALTMKRSGNFDPNHYKTWYSNPSHIRVKTKLIKDHFRKIEEGDAILVVNLTKHGLDGYIGGNVLMEMAIAFYLKRPIYVYNNIAGKINHEEEIRGMNPKFIDGDLSKIK